MDGVAAVAAARVAAEGAQQDNVVDGPVDSGAGVGGVISSGADGAGMLGGLVRRLAEAANYELQEVEAAEERTTGVASAAGEEGTAGAAGAASIYYEARNEAGGSSGNAGGPARLAIDPESPALGGRGQGQGGLP